MDEQTLQYAMAKSLEVKCVCNVIFKSQDELDLHVLDGGCQAVLQQTVEQNELVILTQQEDDEQFTNDIVGNFVEGVLSNVIDRFYVSDVETDNVENATEHTAPTEIQYMDATCGEDEKDDAEVVPVQDELQKLKSQIKLLRQQLAGKEATIKEQEESIRKLEEKNKKHESSE